MKILGVKKGFEVLGYLGFGYLGFWVFGIRRG